MEIFNIAELIKDLGIFDKLKNKLIAQPDIAGKHLAEVLGELVKTFEAIDIELVNYLGIWFDPTNPAQRATERRKLLEFTGDRVKVRMNQARGHCHKIANIYETYLDKWFKRVLNANEYYSMDSLFEKLGSSDDSLIYRINRLSDWLKNNANEILNLLDENNYALANEKIRKDRLEVDPQREKLAKIIDKMQKLQAKFVEITKTL